MYNNFKHFFFQVEGIAVSFIYLFLHSFNFFFFLHIPEFNACYNAPDVNNCIFMQSVFAY